MIDPTHRFPLTPTEIEHFCQRWQIAELALFGSILRSDFTDTSDIDLLVTFLPEERWSLLDLVRMKTELEDRIKRSIDLVEKKQLKNPFRRATILQTQHTLYVHPTT